MNGKYYKFNYEINNIYYCDNNIIIDNFEVKKLTDNYILADYFIFDKHNKTVKLYDKKIEDSFVDGFGEIKNIDYVENKKPRRCDNAEFGGIIDTETNKLYFVNYVHLITL